MRRIVTAARMRELDRAAVDDWGIPGVVLMENAGRAAADELLRHLPESAVGRVAVLCGKGNNGGDGFVICRHLLNRGITAHCLLLGRVAELGGDARTNADILIKAGGPLVEVTEGGQLAPGLAGAGVITDALLGTGLAEAPRGLYAEAIELTNTLPAFVLSVDVPSGVDADTGHAFEPAIRADLTVTMGLLKRGLLLHPGRELAGRTVVADIGIPAAHLNAGGDTFESEPADIAALLPHRPPAGHKGTFGTVLVIAGSRGLSGAACLTGAAAVRAGAGLVKMACPAGTNAVVSARLTEAVKLPLAETAEGTISPDAAPVILEAAKDADCVAIGPGLGAGPSTRELMLGLLPQLNCPMVIDADAINCLAGSLDILGRLKAPAVLTPHPGEMARIEPGPAPDRVELARRFCSRHRVTLVLKGAPTVIAAPGRPVVINPTGNSGLATGGTGDVLTGIIAGLIAQGCPPFDAAQAGVWLHGRAADLAVAELTEYSLAASDLLDYLPSAFAAAGNSCRQ